MSYSYSGNPSNSAKDLVRFLIGDTDQSDWLLQDEEIQYLLSLYNNVALNASIRACESIIAKFSRLADESAGSVSVSFSQKATAYQKMITTLRVRLATDDMQPFAGGISQAQKQIVEANKDRVPPDFSKHMMENKDVAPWVTNQGDNIGDNQEGG